MGQLEIKFRAFDTYTKQMIFTGFAPFGEVLTFGAIEQWLDKHPKPETPSLLRVNDVVIMEFTGLKDKNGKEIYEGDILAYKSSHSRHEGKIFNNVVEFALGQSLCGWRMRNKSCVVKATPYKFGCSEIIGNIYENPGLLKQSL